MAFYDFINTSDVNYVIVTENMFGDILSDLGGATVGGLGMCPGAVEGGAAIVVKELKKVLKTSADRP